jgi:hypothetical protein
MQATAKPDVLTLADTGLQEVVNLLGQYGLSLVVEDDGAPITGSFWGGPEAGVVGRTIYLRRDTPLHSLLHETCHVICMSENRRARLARDAGGDDLEEAAVCYLQVLLSDYLPACGSGRLMRDMDAWGYSFRLGSTRAWFLDDAEDAREFLLNHKLIDDGGRPTFKLRP